MSQFLAIQDFRVRKTRDNCSRWGGIKFAHETEYFYLYVKTQNNSPPSRKAWPASTGITSRGNIPHIPTRIVAGMEYSQASFFTKMFDKSGRNLHGSKPNQLESSATVGFAFRGMARWIFTIAVSETRTENQRKTRMDSPEIFAIIRACLWRHLTPHLNVRTLKVAKLLVFLHWSWAHSTIC